MRKPLQPGLIAVLVVTALAAVPALASDWRPAGRSTPPWSRAKSRAGPFMAPSSRGNWPAVVFVTVMGRQKRLKRACRPGTRLLPGHGRVL
jgi:hypothetical protein